MTSSDWFRRRREIVQLISVLEEGAPSREEIADAAKALKQLYDNAEYLSVSEWIGGDCLVAEQVRRSSFWFGWWRARRIWCRVRRNLRRISFRPRNGEGSDD